MDKRSAFTLQEIAQWKENNLVALPPVQRGFVWKPFQIENLWDSLLRGYPVGAFVLSPNSQRAGTFEILDGQQRATSICLGFGNKTFRASENKIKVFIDLDVPKGEDNRKYIFRVITKSHPWGYRKTDNTKTLTAENIRKAMTLYSIEDYLEADLDSFFPYDSYFPIPFEVFINAAIAHSSQDQLLKEINYWLKSKKVTNGLEAKTLPSLSDNKLQDRIFEIYSAVKRILDKECGQCIPALYLDFDRFRATLNTEDSENGELSENNEDEESDDVEDPDENEQSDEIENLFIRLNAGGTPLRGEELNYSILKAHISLKLQRQIEDASKALFRPARFITIAYRLFQNQAENKQRDARTMRIKPKQFQKTVDGKKKDFEAFLKRVFTEQVCAGKTLLQYTDELLKYNKTKNTYGLPYLITSKIADQAPEIMFMILYRVMVRKDRFKTNDSVHKKMIGMVTLFMWLGKGNKLKDHSKLLSNIWGNVKEAKRDSFWGPSTVELALIDDILTPFPTYNGKFDRKSLIQLSKFKSGNIVEQFGIKTNHKLFLQKVINNRDLILYAQRDFLSSFFKDKQYELDDTNVPFDWDHISPYKFIHRRFYIPPIIKDWYNTNGNFRAWPYALNRMDQDDVPAFKLNPLNGAISEDQRKINKEKWDGFIKRNGELIKSDKQLSQILLKWSFCTKDWANCDVSNMKKDWEIVFNLIIKRNLMICKEWYDSLLIDDLNPNITNANQ